MDEGESAVRRRARDTMARIARRAYEAAHGEPAVSAPRGVRWRVEPKVAVSASLVLALALAVVSWSTGPASPGGSNPEPAAPPSVSSTPLVVDVAGAVASPGVFELGGTARVRDAIDAPVGFTEGAERASINLAWPLIDDKQVHVPREGEGGAGPVNVNRADAAGLEQLPGISPVPAGRIVAHRAANGPFARVEDLERVSGIGPALVARLAGLATE